MPLWLIHLLALATALALAEHWLRYALVERKRHRRAVDRLERIRRGKERREREEDDREWAKFLAERRTEPRLAESLHAQMQAEQARAMQGVGGLGSQADAFAQIGTLMERQLMTMGQNPAAQEVRDPLYHRQLGACTCIFCQRATGRYDTGTIPRER